MPQPAARDGLPALAQRLRNELENKTFIIPREFIAHHPFNPESCNAADAEEEAP